MAAADGPPEAGPLERAPFMCRNTPTTPANGYFIIRLVEDALSVRLLIRECDGYLVAIQRGDGFWFHFDGETPPDFIAESSVQMRMEASYVSLAPNGRQLFQVGPAQLRNAFCILLKHNNEVAMGTNRYDDQRMALAFMCVVFCEGRR
ncbi:hypothetical protein BRADI_3g40565v3 [Brachypodium distachyon]|uniref:rRNA N-glycosylase n=1 Tax=Brachypodium distachyon TaxID=15368 RepID=A0A2K2D2E4_BRADI|nr:hypothetical protein BRADI_3g40565v3 [Brachypodium distachyon]